MVLVVKLASVFGVVWVRGFKRDGKRIGRENGIRCDFVASMGLDVSHVSFEGVRGRCAEDGGKSICCS